MAKKRAKKGLNQHEIRDKIATMMVDAISKGTPPWRKPWANSPNAGAPRNFNSKHRYMGINPLILMWTAMAEGYESCNWGSSYAWGKNLHVHVRKGEKATSVIYYHIVEEKKDGKVVMGKNGKPKTFPILKEYKVFNADQVQAPDVATLLDGRCRSGKHGSFVRNLLDPESTDARPNMATAEELQVIIEKLVPKTMQKKFRANALKPRAQLIHDAIQAKLDTYRVMELEAQNNDPDFEPAEEFIKATGAKITHRGSRACHNTLTHAIMLPPKKRFDCIEAYYETAFHELVHWGEHEVGKADYEFGKKYAFGELVAEIGACILMMELGVPMPGDMLAHSQSYVKGWLKGMTTTDKSDKPTLNPKFIFDAATQAGKVADYLLTFVGKQNPVEERPVSKGQSVQERAA